MLAEHPDSVPRSFEIHRKRVSVDQRRVDTHATVPLANATAALLTQNNFRGVRIRGVDTVDPQAMKHAASQVFRTAGAAHWCVNEPVARHGAFGSQEPRRLGHSVAGAQYFVLVVSEEQNDIRLKSERRSWRRHFGKRRCRRRWARAGDWHPYPTWVVAVRCHWVCSHPASHTSVKRPCHAAASRGTQGAALARTIGGGRAQRRLLVHQTMRDEPKRSRTYWIPRLANHHRGGGGDKGWHSPQQTHDRAFHTPSARRIPTRLSVAKAADLSCRQLRDGDEQTMGATKGPNERFEGRRDARRHRLARVRAPPRTP